MYSKNFRKAKQIEFNGEVVTVWERPIGLLLRIENGESVSTTSVIEECTDIKEPESVGPALFRAIMSAVNELESSAVKGDKAGE